MEGLGEELEAETTERVEEGEKRRGEGRKKGRM
jgi:hypothetical protein